VVGCFVTGILVVWLKGCGVTIFVGYSVGCFVVGMLVGYFVGCPVVHHCIVGLSVSATGFSVG
jgi:Sec-independent protein secretion pathway component TatC